MPLSRALLPAAAAQRHGAEVYGWLRNVGWSAARHHAGNSGGTAARRGRNTLPRCRGGTFAGAAKFQAGAFRMTPDHSRSVPRRLRLGMVGGGPGGFIGAVHRIAARLDGRYELVAAALTSDPARSRAAAAG